MEIKKEVLPKSKVKLTIKVSSSEMRGFFSRAYKKLVPTVEVKGFRPGMAPKSLVISAIGENRLNSEIIDLALNETYTAAIKKEDLMPVAPPQVNIKIVKDLTVDTAELEYEVEIDVLPKVTVGDYKKLKVKNKKQKEIKTNNEEIEHVISHLANQAAEIKDIDRPVKMGDRVEINFEGSEKGVVLENLTSKNYPVVLGSKVLIPEFEEKLVGLKKGDKKEFSVKMKVKPEDNSQTGGKNIDFKVEILQTQEVILPKIDDAFAKNFQKKTLEELKTAIRDDILKQKETQEHRNLENQVLEELLKITKAEIPDSLIDQESDRLIAEMRSRTAMQGLSFEDYLNNLKKTLEEFKTELRPQAEKTVKIGLALGEVLKNESKDWQIDLKDKDAVRKTVDKLVELSVR